MSIQLYNFQEELVQKAAKKTTEGYSKILICLATGGGKTIIFTEMMRRAVAKNRRVWAIVHREKLIDQTIKHFPEHKVFKLTRDARKIRDPYTGKYRVYDGTHYLDECDICIAMVGTAYSRKYDELYNKFDILIADEAHLREHDKVINESGAKLVLGMTATPTRLGKENHLRDLYQCIVEGPPVSFLLKEGFLTKAYYFRHGHATNEGLKKAGTDYSSKSFFEASEKQRFDSSAGILKMHKQLNRINYFGGEKRWLKMLMFCASIDQAEREASILNKKFGRDGKPYCKVIHSKMNDNDNAARKLREQILDEHQRGVFPLLINVGVLTEGYDDKSLEAVILNRKTLSLALFVQMVGRVLRAMKGKEICFVLDLWNNCDKHGFYGVDGEADIDWHDIYLNDGKKKKDKEDAKPAKECKDDKFGEGCGALNFMNATECVVCEKQFEIKRKETKVLEEGLEMVTKTDMKKNKNRQSKVYTSFFEKYLALKESGVEISQNMNHIHSHFQKAYDMGYTANYAIRSVKYGQGIVGLKELGKLLGYSPYWAHAKNKELS